MFLILTQNACLNYSLDEHAAFKQEPWHLTLKLEQFHDHIIVITIRLVNVVAISFIKTTGSLRKEQFE